MFSNKFVEKHWLTVFIRFITDALLFFISFDIALFIRFQEAPDITYYDYIPGVIFGALVFSCGIYIFGFYSPKHHKANLLKQSLILIFLHIVSTIAMSGVFYLTIIKIMGRGVMFIGTIISYGFVWMHHYSLSKWNKLNPDIAAMIISSKEDEVDLKNLLKNDAHNIKIRGIIIHGNYSPGDSLKVFGDTKNLTEIAKNGKFDRIICTNRTISEKSLYRDFCYLRYMGIPVVPEISIYEEFYQCCPISQVTPEWLLNASLSPQFFYIKKLKRGFDIILSIFGLLFSSPILLISMMLIKLTSKGPIFYSQTRLGQFGKPFNVLKLRTMKVDAEKNGPEWSKDNDPRTTTFGKYFRKYRIDELPQLVNVLKGEMSFVGPRPERPEFTKSLSESIPFFQERLLIQPGITGWAQVNYSYGNSIKDAEKKLEYDLYYLKNLSLFLDVFILLDTIRIVISGGAINESDFFMQSYDKEKQQWEV